jgi:integrase/recombinase XerC
VIGKLAEDYLSHLAFERRLAALTLHHYRRDLELLGEMMAQRPLSALQHQDVRRFLAQLHGKGLSPKSLARLLSAWRGFFEHARRGGHLAHNPADGVRAPKAEKRLPEVLSPDEASRLVAIEDDSTWGRRDRALFELAYSCGLRVSELVGLDVTGIDLANGEVRVTGKGSKTRIVPVGKPALAAVRDWLAVRQSLKGSDTQALFLGQRGLRLSPRVVQTRIKQWATRQGISADVHPHMLRHSFASHVLQSSGDLRAVQEMLGHASIASTQVYTHLDFQHLAKVYDAAHPRAKKKAK